MEVYLDNNATTKIDPRVLQSTQSLQEIPLNPSSVHFYGRKAKSLLEESRSLIADCLSVDAQELFFCSGATEAINTLIKGFVQKKTRIISSRIEHSCVYETMQSLEKKLFSVEYLPIVEGMVSLSALENALKIHQEQEVLVVLSSVNSETGAFLDLEKLAHLCQIHKAYLIIDAVAHLGKAPLTLFEGISAACFSPHKFHGPKGIGFFYAKKSFLFSSLLLGGSQEKSKRAGTENVEGAIQSAKAVEIATKEVEKNQKHLVFLRDYFEKEIKALSPNIQVNGPKTRISNVSNLQFPADGESLFMALDQKKIASSLGSACASGLVEASRVLLEMGLPEEKARSSIRFSLGKYNTKEEIDYTISTIRSFLKAFDRN